MQNDVLALLEMMLTFGQMMLCPADTNEKIQADWLGFFGSPCWTRTQLSFALRAQPRIASQFYPVRGFAAQGGADVRGQ